MSTTASFILGSSSLGRNRRARRRPPSLTWRNDRVASNTVRRKPRTREADDESKEDGGAVARRAEPRAVPRPAGEGDGGTVLGRVRPHLRARQLHLRGLWGG